MAGAETHLALSKNMDFIRFLKGNAPWLGAGALMATSTGFGQTFFISLYADVWRAEFNLSHGGFGALYMGATLCSAAALTQAGGLVDGMRARVLAGGVLVAFAGICVLMSLVSAWWMLGLCLFGLRFCGQGMLSHIAITMMAKWFRANRGRAIATASLGFSIGEALLPAAAILAIAAFGWRVSWLMAAAMLIGLIFPVLLILLRKERAPQRAAETGVSAGMNGHHWSRAEMVRHWAFWALLPGLIAPGWIGTVVFFQIRHLTDIKEWDILPYAALAYPLYSITAIAASFLFGWAVDRLGAVRLLPVYLLGWGGGTLLLGGAGGLHAGVAAMAVAGIGAGGVGVVVSTLMAELYGTLKLGRIKALTAALMVLASALGPGVSGALLDVEIGFEAQCIAMGAYLLLVSVWFAYVSTRLQPQVTRRP